MAATQPNNFIYTVRPRYPGLARLALAGGWLLVIGLLDVFYAISVIAGSEVFITTASWLVGDARPWGWLMLAVGLIQCAGGVGVWLGRRWALWVGALSICVHALGQVLVFSEYPAVAIALLLLDASVLFALFTTIGDRRPSLAGTA